ncbi:DNA glycosylase [Xylariaceae sp. FL0662B]|nr:DNA glycosylase [Xylariaceae sp. FL0662B]
MGTDGNEEDTAVEATHPHPKEPSFEGRLQLKEFIFAGTGNKTVAPGMRRSHRLLTSQPTSHSSPPAQEQQPRPESPPRSKKRKKQPVVAQSTSNNNGSSNNIESTTTTPPPPAPPQKKKKRKRPAPSYAPPSTYAHLPYLPDAIAPNLLILFIGLNPGVETARTGHAYAHPSNLFWKLLARSGITPGPIPCAAADDRELPARHQLGLTNIVARPSRSGAELSREEMDDGVAALHRKCARWRPEVACLVGKGIWDSVARVHRADGKRPRSQAPAEFQYGWQDDRLGAGDGWEGSRVFVATSTSGLAATLRPAEKERIWKVLGDWCVQRRKERGEGEGEGEGGR